MISLIFWIMSLLGCLYVFIYGGQEGKLAAIGYTFAVLLTMAIQRNGPLTEFDRDVFFIDLLFFIYLYCISMFSIHYWLLYIAGFQLAGVISHLAILIICSKTPKIIELFLGFWAIPIILSMVIGVFISERGRNEAFEK